MADNFKAEDMDGNHFPHVRVNDRRHGYIIFNDSPEGTMEGARRLARLFAAVPKLLEACQEWQALEEVMAECSSCNTEGYMGEICLNHFKQREDIEAMRDAAIKAALSEEGGGK